MRAFLLAVLVALLLAPAPAIAREPLANITPPAVCCDPVFGVRMTVEPGTWTPEPVSYAYQWLRGGHPIDGAVKRGYRPTLADLDHRLSVQVTATDALGNQGTATTAPSSRTRRADLVVHRNAQIRGLVRYTRTLSVEPGRWDHQPTRRRYVWLRSGVPIEGATGRRYTLGVADVGHKIKVRERVKRPGYGWARVASSATAPVGYRVPVRRTVTYRIETRGAISTSVREFAQLAAQTYADPRGWRNAGVAFRRVNGPSDFSLVLAEASWLPRFSPVCSVQWSCRAGRYVVINQLRWKFASPSWNGAGKSLRDYRNLVVNHETGHWLGHGHLGCPGPGRLAPVMMQQSKGLAGCRHNPWPLPSELWSR